MKLSEEKIKKVLAMFNEEDLPYVDINLVKEIYNERNNKEKMKINVLKLGGKNDRTRK